MNAEDMSLPQAAQAAFISEAHIHPEWRIDPAFLRVLDPGVAVRIVGIRMEYLAKEAVLRAQILEAESRMFEEMSQALKRG